MVGTFSDAHLTNSQDLISSLNSFYNSNPQHLSAPLLSLDVASLFTNVPLDIVLSFLRKKISDNNIQLPVGLTLDALIQLIDLCCSKYTIFSFNNIFYKQIDGVAMGSPLACILANIFMECYESELLSTFPYRPLFWKRYVDDIICIWPHGKESFQPFLDGLNQLVPSIKLTVEWESMDPNKDIATLPFLDVLIHRSPLSVSFSVYRKPTHCHAYIHYFSNHAPHVKKSVLSSLFLRALRVCSPEHLQPELDILTTAFRRLGYPHFFIRRALSHAKTKFHALPPPPAPPSIHPTKPKVIVLPYQPVLACLNPIMQSANYKFVYNYRDTIGHAVVNCK